MFSQDVHLVVLSIVPLPFMVIIWAYVTDQKLQHTSRALSLEVGVYMI